MSEYASGEIVLIDWRGDGLAKEANKLRPCVVVEDDELFDAAHPTVIVVPLTSDESMVIPQLSTVVEPTPDNGCQRRSFAISHAVVTAAKGRVRGRPGTRITLDQLRSIRRQIAETIGYRD
ncbi:MAG TPA: type II toxin-antitoxin system PemK/MazF family toxin [Candidatus Baltobacteraceae bacterium]|nr:type II toxin-antitoxin system PemK/MazF family toxin [Candidatus Baltobacteraceae bacterium]